MLYMKKCFIVLLLFSAALLGSPALALAQSVALNQEQLNALAANCTAIQVTLSHVEKNDAVARINRGRDYDQMMTQINAFISRLNYNKSNQPQLKQIADELQAAINQFRTDYVIYDSQLSNAMGINCKSKPQDFYNTIVLARNGRATLSEEVTAIADLMSKYRDALVQYQTTLPGGIQ